MCSSDLSSVGDSAFEGCTNLVDIMFSSATATADFSVGNNSFKDDASLAKVTLPNNIVSIGDYAFYNCYSIMDLRNIDVAENASTTEGRITLPNTVQSVGTHAFANPAEVDETLCKIYNVDIKTTHLGPYMFAYNKNLHNILIPDGVEEDYILPEGIFIGCPAIETLNPNDTYNLVIPSDVTEIDSYAFAHSKNILSVYMPTSVSTVGTNVFEGCSSLKTVVIESTALGDYMFQDCISLETLQIDRKSVV